MNLRTELLGGILNWVSAGTMVSHGQGGQVAASATVKPSAASGVWESLGCTLSVKPETKKEAETIKCFSPVTGKWEEDVIETVVADYLDVVVKNHQELVWKLLFGVKGEMPTNGQTPVIPFEEAERKVAGWVQFQARSGRDNTNRSVFDLWVEMTIKSYPGWTDKTAKPELRFTVKSSPLNSQIFMAGI